MLQFICRRLLKAKGLGGDLYTELIRILTAQGFRRAYGGIALPNAASAALHEKMGFRHLGTYTKVGFKLRQRHDVGWWQYPIDSTEGAPEDIVPFAKLTG